MRIFGLSLLLAALSLACSSGGDEDAPTAEASLSGTPSTAIAAYGDSEWWRPDAAISWQWQLQGEVDTSYDVDVYDIDLFDSDPALIAALHDAGRRVVCYFSAGSAEDWRPDYADFPEERVGKPLADWEGERWVDIRAPEVLAVMLARLDLARERGCDGVEPDNVQGYDDDTGFDLTAADQLAYNRRIADEAHARGLAVGLKNSGAQAAELVDWYDFALNEECHQYEECSDFAPFLAVGKPVLNAEYRDSRDDAENLADEVCPQANAAGLRTLILPLDLDDSFRVACFERP